MSTINVGIGHNDYFTVPRFADIKLFADAAAESIIEIDEYGNWSLAERPGGDGDPTEVDCGTLEVNSADEGQYFAVSTMFDDVVYDMTVIGDDVMYWGGENDYYERLE